MTTFFTVTTFVVAGTAIYILIFQRHATLSADILWQILLTSFLTSFGVWLYQKPDMCKKEIVVRTIIHYLYVNFIILVCGAWFEWYDVTNWIMVVGLCIVVAIVFFIVSVICWRRNIKETELINERLLEYQNQQEDETVSKSSEELRK